MDLTQLEFHLFAYDRLEKEIRIIFYLFIYIFLLERYSITQRISDYFCILDHYYN